MFISGIDEVSADGATGLLLAAEGGHTDLVRWNTFFPCVPMTCFKDIFGYMDVVEAEHPNTRFEACIHPLGCF